MTRQKVSIVIPTTGKRQNLLQRAITSAFVDDESLSTEIIVIANGAEWEDFSLPDGIELPLNATIRVLCAKQADANHARSLGIEYATGMVLRFLDDDDYLIPEAARAQYHFTLQENLDFCSGNAEIRDQDNSLIDTLVQPEEQTACAATLTRKRVQLTFSPVYRTATLNGLQWPVGLRQSEDIVWLVRYVTAAHRRWKHFDCAVGVWYQHAGERQSLNRPSGFIHEATAQALLEAKVTLQQQRRWDEHLAHLTAEALMDLVHRSFPFRPLYWTSVANQALQMNQRARPPQPVYAYAGFRQFDPRLLLWLLLPKRWFSLGWVSAKNLIAGRDYRRTL
ncbi:glycosyltransferase [Lampropedia puyangensis]|uniref:Glycosyltransferase n=1 Tax=Lampropedia puyangensis TaxID=1330072 RepID=A0A4S8FCY1_9BURK|nr:glycosyltransferase [Lampropedia puyangensis]THU03712.1 glycosyltransferase [Lampropedia puyangensis]